MSELLKKPYELSIWSEHFVYIGNDGKEYLKASDVMTGIKNQFIKEKKIAVIGTDTMVSPIRAYDPKLTQNVNGTNSFTFQMYYRYYDEEDEEFKINPFINLLTNERKIKLNYDGEWFDFVIKEIKEKSEDNIFTYTCKDQYITELSKTGYEVELDVELENNMGTVTELGAKILEGSEWTVNVEGSELIRQTVREPLMYWKVQGSWTLKAMEPFTHNGESWSMGGSLTVAKGGEVYVSYTGYTNRTPPFQVIFVPGEKSGDNYLNGKLLVDENGVVINGYHFTATGFSEDYTKMVPANVFGELLVSKPITKYVTEIDKYCNVYERNEGNEEEPNMVEYYGYSENEYVSPVLTNDLISDKSWFSEGAGSTIKYEDRLESGALEEVVATTLTKGVPIYNTGLYDNRSFLKNLVKGEEYIFAIKKAVTREGEVSELPLLKITVQGQKTKYLPNNGFDEAEEGDENKKDQHTVGAVIDDLLVFSKYNDSIPAELGDYAVYKATFGEKLNVSESEFLTYTLKLKIDLDPEAATTASFGIADAKFFKLMLDADNKWVVPDLQRTINSIIRTKYFFFDSEQVKKDPQEVFSTKDLKFSYVGYEEIPTGFIQQFSRDCEKIRSIKGSKSNRFNLIQELCETFECWAKFEIEHDTRGAIKYKYEEIDPSEVVEGSVCYSRPNDPTFDPTLDVSYTRIMVGENFSINPNLLYYRRLAGKTVTFKKYVGEHNHAGFRYGINLKSIQRTTKTDQITTRMIVQPNIIEYATGGFCSIQDALLNPTSENVMYNFEYYIRQNLLSREDLENDLYGHNNGLGLYPKLRAWNDAMKPLVTEQTQLSSVINTLTSRKTVYETIVEEALNEKVEAETEIGAANGNVDDKNDDANKTEYIEELFIKKERAEASIEKYQGLLDNVSSILAAYKTTDAGLTSQINNIAKMKNALSFEFYKKYIRFIQEGTWTSSEYYDPDDYYLDAIYVLRTSAFPKVEYNIEVIEISQTEDCAAYRFKIGDKTHVEDTEFFGWDSKGRPYREEVVISALTYNLDDPSKNTIKVQNYKTQFEDLFQRITATSQALQYAEGRYERAAKAVDSEGFDSSLLQESLKNNALIIQNAQNENVVWDKTGITLTNGINLNQLVRLTSAGIVLSQDGGKSWTTGITAEGINASVITTGRLDTNKIRIFNAVAPTFEWNWNGISAYAVASANSGPNYNQFIRFNQFGLFGTHSTIRKVNGVDTLIDWNDLDNIWKYSDFSLTWYGLRINATPDSYGLKSGDIEKTPIISFGSGGDKAGTDEEECYFRIYSNGEIKSKTLASTVDVDGKLRDLQTTFKHTAESLRITFEDKLNQSITEVTGEINSLSSYFELTASNLKIGFDAQIASTNGAIEALGENVSSQITKLSSDLTYNAEKLRVEFQNQTTTNYTDLSSQISNLSSEFELTAKHLEIGFSEQLSSTRGELVADYTSRLEFSARELRAEFQNNINGLSSDFSVTAEALRSEFKNDLGGYSTIEQTAEKISLAVVGDASWDGVTSVKSMISAGLDGIYLSYGDVSEDNYASISISRTGEKEPITTISLTGLVGFYDLETEGYTTIHGGNLKTGTVTADNLRGGSFDLTDDDGDTVGHFYFGKTFNNDTLAVDLTSTKSIRMCATNEGNLFLGTYFSTEPSTSASDLGPFITLNCKKQTIALGHGYVLLNSFNHGGKLPAPVGEGQIFFLY